MNINRRTFLQSVWFWIAWINSIDLEKEAKEPSNYLYDYLFWDKNLKQLDYINQIEDKKTETVVKNTKKRIYITIDDGPSKYLLPMADELEKYWHRWIFFFIWSSIRWYKNQIIEILNRWHQIANHSWSHPAFASISIDRAKYEIKKTDDIIRNIIEESRQNSDQKLLFRYPYWSQISRIKSGEFREFLEENWYYKKPLMWDVDTNDWRKWKSVQEITKSTIYTPENKVVLMHERQKTLEAVKIFSKELASNNKVGWTFS